MPDSLFVSIKVGDFYGSDEVVSDCLSGHKASIETYDQTTFGVVGYTLSKGKSLTPCHGKFKFSLPDSGK